MKRILVVEDEAIQRKALVRILSSNTFAVEEAASGEEALDSIRAGEFDCVLLDHIMPNMSGMDVLIEIKKMKPIMCVIMITGFATIEAAVEAIKKGASNYLSKPFQVEKLIVAIRRALKESKFETFTSTADLDVTFGSLSHQTRRNIISLLRQNNKMHLMEMVRSLDIEDHTKIVFHTRVLKESGIINQGKDKSYFLTAEGEKITNCLYMIGNDFTM